MTKQELSLFYRWKNFVPVMLADLPDLPISKKKVRTDLEL